MSRWRIIFYTKKKKGRVQDATKSTWMQQPAMQTIQSLTNKWQSGITEIWQVCQLLLLCIIYSSFPINSIPSNPIVDSFHSIYQGSCGSWTPAWFLIMEQWIVPQFMSNSYQQQLSANIHLSLLHIFYIQMMPFCQLGDNTTSSHHWKPFQWSLLPFPTWLINTAPSTCAIN